MKIAGMFPSEYLRAADLEDQPRTLKIQRIEKAEVGKDKEIRPIVYFSGEEKGLVLNKTNANIIGKIHGEDDTDDWIGKEITIYPTVVPFGNDMVDAIRVRVPKAAPRREFTAKASQPEYDDDGYPIK